MRVKPRSGLKVRDPLTRMHLPDEGGDVPDDSFWRRRLRSGDVELLEDRAAEPAGTVLVEEPPSPEHEQAPAGIIDRMARKMRQRGEE
jgi:hypothetical protein